MLRIQIPYSKVLLNPMDYDPSSFDQLLKDFVSKFGKESMILEVFNENIQYLLFMRESQPYWACANDGETFSPMTIREFFLKVIKTQFPRIVIYQTDILLFHSLLVYFQKKPELKVSTTLVDLDEILDRVEQRGANAIISARQPGNFLMLRYQKGKPIASYYGFTGNSQSDANRREEFLVRVYTLSSHRPFEINLFTDLTVTHSEDARTIPDNFEGSIVNLFTGRPPKLVVKLKNRPLKTYTLSGHKMSIGRLQDNDIVIDNLSVSRKHAVIESTRDGFVVSDLGSKNGTFVNGEKIDKVHLSNGDVITIGKYDVVFQTSENDAQDITDLDQTVIIPNFNMKRDQNQFHVHFPLSSNITPKLFRRSKMEEYVIDKDRFKIGKGRDADIKIGGLFGPRVEVEIVKEENDFILQKVKGKENIRINGEEMEKKILEEEDLILIGKEEFVFKR